MFTECICLSGLALDFGDTDMTVTDEFMPSLNLHTSMGRQHRPNKKTYQGPFRGKKQTRGKEGSHGGGLLTGRLWNASVRWEHLSEDVQEEK